MGLFKGMKQMKQTVSAAPGLIQQAQDLQAAASQQQAAAAAGGAAPAAAVPPVAVAPAAAADLAPIAGVTLELYAEISKGLAGVGYDVAQAPALAEARGVSAADWQAAVEGWNQRMLSTPAVAQEFNRLYTGR